MTGLLSFVTPQVVGLDTQWNGYHTRRSSSIQGSHWKALTRSLFHIRPCAGPLGTQMTEDRSCPFKNSTSETRDNHNYSNKIGALLDVRTGHSETNGEGTSLPA